MNQFFSLRRFQLLVLKHWAENRRRYSLSVLAFSGLLIVWFVFAILIKADAAMSREMQQVAFFFSLYVVGVFYASQYFNDLGSKPKGINFLLVPASAFEKILCGVLYTTVVFFAVFLAAFYLVDAIMVGIVNSLSLPGATEKAQVINVFKIVAINFNPDSTINFLFLFFSVQSAFLLGSVYFEKFSFVKTVITGFIACFLLFCLIWLFAEQVMPNGDYFRGFFTVYRVHVIGSNDHLIQLPEWVGRTLHFLFTYAIAPFLWLVTYYRLKEKQV